MLYCNLWGSEQKAKKISFQFNNLPLRTVLQQLSEKHFLNFIFNDALVDDVVVTCKAVNESPYSAIKKMLQPYPFSCEFLTRNTIIIRRSVESIKTDRLLNGSVRDAETGSPLESANAYIQGKSIGSATDLNGNFSFAIPDSTMQLIISYMGYETEIQQITSQSNNLDIRLKPGIFKFNTIQITAPPIPEEIEQLSRIQLNEENFVGVIGDVSTEMTYASFMQYNNKEVYLYDNGKSFSVKITGNRLHPMIGTDRNNRLAFKQHQVKLNGFCLQMPFHTTIVPAMNPGIVNYDLIEKSNYKTTVFDVANTDAYESIMDLHYRKGNSNRISGKVKMDLSNSGFVLEGPLTKRISWIINGKKSHLNDLLDSMNKNEWMSLDYRDFQAQLDFLLMQQHNIRFNYIYSSDQISFDPQMNYIRERMMTNSWDYEQMLTQEYIQEINLDNNRFNLNAFLASGMSQISEHWKSELNVSYAEQYYDNRSSWSVEHEMRIPEDTDSTYNYLVSERQR